MAKWMWHWIKGVPDFFFGSQSSKNIPELSLILKVYQAIYLNLYSLFLKLWPAEYCRNNLRCVSMRLFDHTNMFRNYKFSTYWVIQVCEYLWINKCVQCWSIRRIWQDLIEAGSIDLNSFVCFCKLDRCG